MILMGVLHASYITVHYPNDPARQETIKTFDTGHIPYISSADMVRILNAGVFTNNARGKVVIYFGGHRIKISAYSSFVVVDDQDLVIDLTTSSTRSRSIHNINHI